MEVHCVANHFVGKHLMPYIAMLFNNGQTANSLCLLITYFFWWGVEGHGEPTIKFILPKYIEKKNGAKHHEATHGYQSQCSTENQGQRNENIFHAQICHDTGNGYLLLEYILYVWNDDLISQHDSYLKEKHESQLTLEFWNVRGKGEKKNQGSETLAHSCIIILWGCMGAPRWVNVSWVWITALNNYSLALGVFEWWRRHNVM